MESTKGDVVWVPSHTPFSPPSDRQMIFSGETSSVGYILDDKGTGKEKLILDLKSVRLKWVSPEYLHFDFEKEEFNNEEN